MKNYNFKTTEDFCKQVQKSLKNLEANNFSYGYFFVDIERREIIKANGTHFLEFYINILKRLSYYRYDEIEQLKDMTNYLFISDKEIFIKKSKEKRIYKENLGYNYNNYDMKYTDAVFQVIKKSNIKKWINRFTL